MSKALIDAENCLVYTVPEAAALLGLSRNAAYEAIRQRIIPSINLGKKQIRVPKVALHAMLERMEGAR